MRAHLSAGTDAATLCVFDPDALPDDFDERYRHEAAEMLAALDDRVAHWETGGDGGYTLDVWVDEPIAPHLEAYVTVLVERRVFAIRGERLYFTGAEYVFRHDDTRLRQYAHMGSSIAVARGDYRFRLCEFDHPDGHDAAWLASQLTRAERRIDAVMNSLYALAVPGFVASVVALVVAGLRPRALLVIAMEVALIVLARVVSRSPPARRAAAARETYATAFPVYGLVLTRIRDR